MDSAQLPVSALKSNAFQIEASKLGWDNVIVQQKSDYSLTVCWGLDGVLDLNHDVPGVQVSISEDLHGPEVATATAKVGQKTEVTITRPKLWAPETPHLYQASVLLFLIIRVSAWMHLALNFYMPSLDFDSLLSV